MEPAAPGDDLALAPGAPGLPQEPGRKRRLSWADLLRRVHKVDVLDCFDCHGRMRIIAFITDPTTIRAILVHLGLPSDPPPLRRALIPQPDGDPDHWDSYD